MHYPSININVNNKVLVKLTPRGKEICASVNRTVKEDAEGFSEWQLWDLMSQFGEFIYHGCKMPFENRIIYPFFQPF